MDSLPRPVCTGPRWPALALAVALAPAPGAGAEPPAIGAASCEPSAAPAGAATGADVVVGSLIDARLWGIQAGTAAFSVGTTACNAGDETVSWIGQSSNHPAISQALYRLQEGRLEQIGMSWLKHGFVAGAEDACGFGCLNPGTFSQLGIGCSDPYDSILNGDQRGMGPRSELDAATGAFPYPFSTLLQTGDVLYKRLQARIADVDPALNAGARYFAEGHYYAADDALAGNDDDNASYREITFDGALGPTLLGATAVGKGALEAWRDADPGVTLVAVDVPGDGRFLLAAKVTDRGDGTWRYEYALHNFNSHRSARSFTVPVAPGTAAGGFGFHDVDYHSGEPYDPADWPAAPSPTGVTWRTDAEADDPNANALRFATTYNFWLDADRPPASSVATLGLFRVGSPAEVAVVVPGPGAGSALSLRGGRFRVEATYRTPQGQAGAGTAVPLTDDTGFFWFFNPNNVELVVKALDGCGLNGRFWIFSAGLTNVEVDLGVTDTLTGSVKHYLNALGTAYPPKLDTDAFATCGAASPGGLTAGRAPAATGRVSAATELLLRGDRFRVAATFRTAQGQTGAALAVEVTEDTGYFYYFNPNNVEVVLKVHNGCPLNDRFWVFAAGLTNVEVVITVTDTEQGAVVTYTNPLATAFAPIQDTGAFATCP